MNAGKINAYLCDDLHITVTVDRDPGTTPFAINCPVDGCICMATSKMYRVKTNKVPTMEFYRASEKEAELFTGSDLLHHEQGGLFLRPISSSIPEKEYDENTILSLHMTAGNMINLAEVMAIVASTNDQSNPEIFTPETMEKVTSFRNKFAAESARLIPSKYLYNIEEKVKINKG